MIRRFRVRNYRSLRDVEIEPGALTVVTGANGAGKSNLYRALTLAAAAARGNLAPTMVEDGGMPSALWAGDWKKDEPRRLIVDVECDAWRYKVACGVPIPTGQAFQLDPEVKVEELAAIDGMRTLTLLERKGPSAWMRTKGGSKTTYPVVLEPQEAALAQLREPHLYPEIAGVQREMAGWRFYHHFRTDAGSPIRSAQIGTRTPVLSTDGHDLAAAFQTIIEIGDRDGLTTAVDRAFPGARLGIDFGRGQFDTHLFQQGFPRAFAARELSDGTLRYLCLVAALLSPRPPPLLVLNEPDQSLHPDLTGPLTDLILYAAASTQVWVITHSTPLARLLAQAGATAFDLRLENGATAAEQVG
ncbi:recombinase RecF [Oleomonas cavernae]|uniref:Recombinase RecF n=1 Tax=Oleomonas cavernae TaxID=2320859 RepID=A0A418WCL0_9PROT|nr:AAA family ATPase [Oleomonas cavernae]RJF87772.1 recombinase RecF [Oleomonas cavernae]